MVMYKLTGISSNIKVFRRFEVTKSIGSVTCLNSVRVQKLIDSISEEFPGREFKFEVKPCSV